MRHFFSGGHSPWVGRFREIPRGELSRNNKVQPSGSSLRNAWEVTLRDQDRMGCSRLSRNNDGSGLVGSLSAILGKRLRDLDEMHCSRLSRNNDASFWSIGLRNLTHCSFFSCHVTKRTRYAAGPEFSGRGIYRLESAQSDIPIDRCISLCQRRLG